MSGTDDRSEEDAPRRLDEFSLARGLSHLVGMDEDLAAIYDRHGAPPLWEREPGFPTLVRIILEQQVSLASARAAFSRLSEAASPLRPESFTRLDDSTLKRIGFSRQKAAYCRHLALSLMEGRFDLNALEEMDDDAARRELMKLKGIGPWTAEIYLLMALLRPDAWPTGDLALAVSVKSIKRLAHSPSRLELERAAEKWRPWRAVAARLLWHDYLSRQSLRAT